MSEVKYTPNSHKYKREQQEAEANKKKIEKVVKGKVAVKKKSEFQKFMGTFISEDAKNIKSYVFMDILVPTIKKALSDIVNDGISMLLYGEVGHSKKTSSGSKISYRNYYDRKDERYESRASRATYEYDDIILSSRKEAEDVLIAMNEILDKYGSVSIGDLYDLVDVSGSYTDNDYGWTSLRSADVIRTRDGYLLKFPKATSLK